MKRFIIKNENEFCKWIQWTGGVTPLIVFDSDETRAAVYDEDYLSDIFRERVGKTREEMISETYPDVQFIEIIAITVEEHRNQQTLVSVIDYARSKIAVIEKESPGLVSRYSKTVLEELFAIVDRQAKKESQID